LSEVSEDQPQQDVVVVVSEAFAEDVDAAMCSAVSFTPMRTSVEWWSST